MTKTALSVLIAALVTAALIAGGASDAELNKMLQSDDVQALQRALGTAPGWTARVMFNEATDERGDLLTLAAGYGAIRTVSALLAAGADVNGEPAIVSRENVWGHSPLYVAALNEHVNVVRVLLAAKADATYLDAAGFGPLHLAAALGRLDSLQAMIESGVSPDAPSGRGDTALKLAVMKMHTEAAIYLLGKHANPNVEDVRGDTALHEAVRNDDRSLVTALLDHGARSVKNRYGSLPADEARIWAPDLLGVLSGRTPAPPGPKMPKRR
jgi:ankyrin repeat protein